MTRIAALLLVLLSSIAVAQPLVTRGGALKKRQYQTYAAMTLYVDPTGNDNGPCTGTGTAACATLNGALAKVPPRIRHNVTINVAAGTYNETALVSGFTIVPTSGTTTFLIQGSSWSNVSLGAGTATGTITSATTGNATAPITFSTVTDSGQSWTPGALKGYYLTATNGAGSGTSRVIVDNTATTISLNSSTTSVFSAGVTYAIQTPAAVVTTFSTQGNTVVNGSGVSGSLIISDLNVSGNMSFDSNLGDAFGILVRRMYVQGTLSVRRSGIVASSGTNYFAGLSVGVGVNGAGILRDNGGYYRGTISVIGSFIHTNSTASTVTVLEGTAAGAVLSGGSNTGGNAYSLSTLTSQNPSGSVSTNRLWVICSGSSTTGINFVGSLNPSTLGYLNISNCTTGVSLSNGTLMQGSTSGWTFSGVANELVLDGTNYTLSYFNGLSPKSITTNLGTRLTGW